LVKTFDGLAAPAINALSAKIYPGRATGLVGPDGAGKSTLLRMLSGLMAPDSGRALVLGLDPAKEPGELHKILGYMPQRFGLYEDLSVIENMRLYSDIRGLTKKEAAERLPALLEMAALGPFQKRLAGKLSGGMKQKLGLSCVLLGRPKALLLDEPSAGVDPVSRRELWRMVQELAAGGMTVVWATGYLDEAELCPEVILLSQGSLLYGGDPKALASKLSGRCFSLGGLPAQDRREALLGLLKDPRVIDGLVKGGSVRVVTAEGESPPEAEKLSWRAAPPAFEDAFIDLLGGGARGESALAKRGADKPKDCLVVIEARHLHKRFGDFVAVSDNSFEIRRGEIFGLLGPNGAGKSTTFKMMCGLAVPTSGAALIAGIDLKKAPAKARSRIGYMAQKFSLYEGLSVKQNLEFFSGVYGLYGKKRREQVELMVEIFDLGDYLGQSARTLPLGIKQRLALACAVMHRPDAMFLDEPTSGVDPVTRREFWLHINYLATRGVAVMVTTHFMEEAEYCDRVALIDRGVSVAVGAPDDLKARAATSELPDPTMEDAFIYLVSSSEGKGAFSSGRPS
jgi:ABC-2 type transport system ATP-binding protein